MRFFPATLNRTQYVIRLLVTLALVFGAMMFFVGAPAGTTAQLAGALFGLVVLAAYLYNIFGLSLPRLKNARLSLLLLLLALIPLGVPILFLVCLAAPEKT